MKKYYIDRRVLVNGKTSNINNDNKVNLNSIIEQVVQESGGGATTFTDADGFNYGIVFETFVPDNDTIPPASTVLGVGSFYRDPNTGDHYEDFFTNVNSTENPFGGNGTSLVPFSLRSLQDTTNDRLMSLAMSQGEIELETSVISTGDKGVLDVTQSGGNFYWNSGTDSSQGSVNVNSTNVSMSSSDGTGNTVSVSINPQIVNIECFESTVDVTSAISIINNGTSVEIALAGSIASTGSSGSFKIVLNPTDLDHPLKFVLSGLPVYADNNAAQADNLTVNALYQTATGELRIVV